MVRTKKGQENTVLRNGDNVIRAAREAETGFDLFLTSVVTGQSSKQENLPNLQKITSILGCSRISLKALLSYNSYVIQFIHLNGTAQWFLVH